MTACGSVWPLWVHVNCTLTISLDNVYLLVDDSTFASTNNKYLEDSRANRLDLQWNAAPALQWTFGSADQFHDLVKFLAGLCSSFVRKQPKKQNKRDCSIAASQSGCVHLRSIERARYATKHLRDTDRDYVMEKPSRCWLGAVPRYWKVVASCFQIVSFAENTSVPLAPGARISQPILLLFFFVFLLLNLSTKRCLRLFLLRLKL